MVTVRHAPLGPQRLLAELTRAFLAHQVAAQSGDAQATHQLRVYGRRLRVALPLLARKPSGRRVRRARRLLREAVQSAGASRDRDVMLELLRYDLAHDRRRHDAADLLHARLRRSTQRARKRLAALTPGADIHELRGTLRAAAEGPVTGDIALSRIGRQCRDSRKKQRRKLKKLGQRFDPAGLHALRRGLRRLRYTAEIQDRLTGRRSGAVDTLKHMQDRLGHLHDHWVLAAWLDAQADSDRKRHQADYQREARRRSRQALGDARRQHRKWLDEHPAQQLESAYWALSAVRPPAARNRGKKP
jgi:CHAD domain-containing protein